MTNIIVAFKKPEDGRSIRNILVKNGLQTTVSCTCGAQVLANADDLRSGIVICGFCFGDMTCRELGRQLSDAFEILVIASPAKWSGEDMGRLVCLPPPFKMCDLISTVRMLEETQSGRRRERRKKPLPRGDGERAAIDKAKQLLMGRNHMTEPQAHKYLQKCSMDTGCGMAEAAEMILRLYG